ncbi:hypothetical protein [Bacteroides faecis]|uniref:hypothetical protein n=1 Tax=Bacteroides faecis TaxID=674529 RepID=UPI001020A462|nr:hypothetical protein [Bacteroides faecis]KAA5264860.1 hypothetical protein F2Z41_20590 [Bacteroides faecis]MCE9011539.1 hypothetical protein [Bacteroides faecis]RYT82742.1 hypothetical protein EAJ04_20560 [Bacteroides faecis]
MKKIKLQALKEGEYDIEEIIVDDDGKIQRVIPKVYNEVYKGLNLYQETCEVGENPILLRALAIYGLMLPCVVSEAMDWINETYFSFENIIFYPVTTTEDYMKEIYYKDMSITLDKDAFYPLYQKYNNILGIEEYILDEHSEIISYPIRIDNLNWIFKSRCTIATLMKQQLMEWRKILPNAHFMIEYCAKFQLSD